MKSSKEKPRTTHQSPEAAILRSAYSVFCWIPPVVRRLFEVNSEPHTGARPSVRLCVGLKKKLDLIQNQVTQRPMLRVEVYARALRASQHVK